MRQEKSYKKKEGIRLTSNLWERVLALARRFKYINYESITPHHHHESNTFLYQTESYSVLDALYIRATIKQRDSRKEQLPPPA